MVGGERGARWKSGQYDDRDGDDGDDDDDYDVDDYHECPCSKQLKCCLRIGLPHYL